MIDYDNWPSDIERRLIMLTAWMATYMAMDCWSSTSLFYGTTLNTKAAYLFAPASINEPAERSPQIFDSYQEKEAALGAKELVLQDLKAPFSQLLVGFLETLRTFCEKDCTSLDSAYPSSFESTLQPPRSLDIRVGTVVTLSLHLSKSLFAEILLNM